MVLPSKEEPLEGVEISIIYRRKGKEIEYTNNDNALYKIICYKKNLFSKVLHSQNSIIPNSDEIYNILEDARCRICMCW